MTAPHHSPHDGFDPARDRYGVIVGHGRSGTNLALDVLDQHPLTAARNEPNEIADGDFAALPADFLGPVDDGPFVEAWRRAVARAALRKSVRDRRDRRFKQYYRNRFWAAYCESVLGRRKLRRLLLGSDPGEWGLPAGSVSPHRAFPVLKILLMPQWVVATHGRDAGQHVLHIVRRPQDFLNSWMARYVGRHPGGPEQVYRDNLATLPGILDHFGRSRLHPLRYSPEALIETEMWRWRYQNDVVNLALAPSPRYLLRSYDELTDPARHPELLEWVGLAIDPGTKARLAAMRNTLFGERGRDLLPAQMVEPVVAHVLRGSPFAGEALAR